MIGADQSDSKRSALSRRSNVNQSVIIKKVDDKKKDFDKLRVESGSQIKNKNGP